MATKLGVYSARSVGANTTHCVTDCQEVTSGKGTRYKNGKRILVRSTQFLNPIFILLRSQFYAFSFFLLFSFIDCCIQRIYTKGKFYAYFIYKITWRILIRFVIFESKLDFITMWWAEQTSLCWWDTFRRSAIQMNLKIIKQILVI